MDFFSWWVGSLWGGGMMAFFGTGLMFYLIGMFSRMGKHLLISLMFLYMLVFGSGFFGSMVGLLAIIGAGIYFVTAFMPGSN